jgi:ketosteroid isomerase-like protein
VKPVRVLLIVLAITLGPACNSRTDEDQRARQTATDFYSAFAQQDGTAACALLAPRTQHEIEKSAKQPCDEAITDEDLPAELGRIIDTTVHGNEARVAADGDTVFVSDFGGAWRIVAVGCTPQAGDLPYDCEIQGG